MTKRPPQMCFERLWKRRFGARTTYVACALLAASLATAAHAQECPGPYAPLKEVRDAVNDMIKADRAPAAADCALSWSSSITAEDLEAGIKDPNYLRFFMEAADANRRAYEKRKLANLLDIAERYLEAEIAIRTRFLEAVADQPSARTEVLQRATVRHLTEIANALALRAKYAEVDSFLARKSPSVIDEAAVSVWTQAIWSCAKFDGKKGDVCAYKDQCRDRIQTFLASVDKMQGREFSLPTTMEIDGLRRLSGAGGCLQ